MAVQTGLVLEKADLSHKTHHNIHKNNNKEKHPNKIYCCLFSQHKLFKAIRIRI